MSTQVKVGKSIIVESPSSGNISVGFERAHTSVIELKEQGYLLRPQHYCEINIELDNNVVPKISHGLFRSGISVDYILIDRHWSELKSLYSVRLHNSNLNHSVRIKQDTVVFAW